MLRLKSTLAHYQQAASAGSEHPANGYQPNSDNKAGVLSALQGIKAENSLVLAVFLKILLLGSSGSIVAARLAQTGYGHTVGTLQGLSLIPVAIGLFLFTRYVLKQQLHLRKGFQWGLLLGGITILFLSNRYSAMQRKYAIVPAPPVATAVPRVAQEQYSRLRALPTAEDADRAIESHFGDNPDKDWEWRKRS
ncbi:MAG: hypothetical protein FRX49_11643 [Trebouxia sp. A1-2]|nr:MAG: hypothetical protein FRX49_11643 [Trebouxia sp. A1-2]